MPKAHVAIRISGVGHQAPGFEQLLQGGWGYRPERDGDDLVVLATDPGLNTPTKDILKLQGPLQLTEENRHKLAGKLLSWIPRGLDEYFAKNAQSVSLKFDEDSTLNRVYACRTRLAMSPRKNVRAIIRDELLPIMIKMGADSVYGVTTDVNSQQAIYTFAKCGLLFKKHELSEVNKLILEREALAGILPSGFNPFLYVNALTRLAPIAVTLPVTRGDCAWHFVAPRSFIFTLSVLCEGLFQQFVELTSPISKEGDIIPTDLSTIIKTCNAGPYLKTVVKSINNITSFLNGLQNFIVDEIQTVDFARQIQAFGAIDLLFSDLASLNLATVSYHRISFSMNALDKLANLIKHVGRAPELEPAIFKSLLTIQQCKTCCRIYLEQIRPISNDVSEILIGMTENVYKKMHLHCKKEMDSNAAENHIVNRMYQQRNLRHGTFLNGEQFEQVFGRSKGTVASEIVMVVFLLTLAVFLTFLSCG